MVERLRILMQYLWLHGQDGCPFVFNEPFFKKVATAGLNSLWQKGYQILVKNLIFDDPFHKKRIVLVIYVPGMIQRSGRVNFLMKWGCWGHWGHWGCWGCRGHWGCKVLRPGKSLLRTSESSLFLNLALFWCFEKKRYLHRTMKYHFEF